MHVIKARNVHGALPMAIDHLLRTGDIRSSRFGEVMVARTPVTTEYIKPCERVIFWPDRNANPFFHLMEALWMLAGRNDVSYLKQFVSNFDRFSDNGLTLHGAYGFRWREHFGTDQLEVVAKRLSSDHTDRRSIIAMWDGNIDLGAPSKDIPCNMLIQLQVSTLGSLDMNVFNRSNDIIWGCYGANAVHMSVLQEYMAAAIGVPVGQYWQVSGNWHAYTATLYPLKHLASEAHDGYRSITRFDGYAMEPTLKPFPLVSTKIKDWDLDLALFMEDPAAEGFRDPFFRKIAKPMFLAHKVFKQRRIAETIFDRCIKSAEILSQMPADNDWRFAALDWIGAHERKARNVADGGSQHANH